MKRSIFIAVLGMGAASVAFGQGKIDFSNYINGSSPTVNYAATGVPAGKAGLTLGSSFNAALLYYVGSSAGDVPANMAAMTLFTGNTPVFGLNAPPTADGGSYAGWFEGGSITIPGVTASNNTFVSFLVEAFNGTSYVATASLVNGVRGISAIFQSPTSQTSGSATPGMVVPGFTVASVPEPTTLALAGLGGLASLVMLRRKNA